MWATGTLSYHVILAEMHVSNMHVNGLFNVNSSSQAPHPTPLETPVPLHQCSLEFQDVHLKSVCLLPDPHLPE